MVISSSHEQLFCLCGCKISSIGATLHAACGNYLIPLKIKMYKMASLEVVARQCCARGYPSETALLLWVVLLLKYRRIHFLRKLWRICIPLCSPTWFLYCLCRRQKKNIYIYIQRFSLSNFQAGALRYHLIARSQTTDSAKVLCKLCNYLPITPWHSGVPVMFYTGFSEILTVTSAGYLSSILCLTFHVYHLGKTNIP